MVLCLCTAPRRLQLSSLALHPFLHMGAVFAIYHGNIQLHLPKVHSLTTSGVTSTPVRLRGRYRRSITVGQGCTTFFGQGPKCTFLSALEGCRQNYYPNFSKRCTKTRK